MVIKTTLDGQVIVGSHRAVNAIADPDPNRFYIGMDGTSVSKKSLNEQLREGLLIGAAGTVLGIALVGASMVYFGLAVVDLVATPFRKDARDTLLLRLDKWVEDLDRSHNWLD